MNSRVAMTSKKEVCYRSVLKTFSKPNDPASSAEFIARHRTSIASSLSKFVGGIQSTLSASPFQNGPSFRAARQTKSSACFGSSLCPFSSLQSLQNCSFRSVKLQLKIWRTNNRTKNLAENLVKNRIRTLAKNLAKGAGKLFVPPLGLTRNFLEFLGFTNVFWRLL